MIRLPHPTDSVALTFDDGPDPSATPRILDLLDAAGAQASFFCIGIRAARHPALIARIVAGGHTVETHTWSRPATFAAYGRRRIANEVLRAQDVLTDLAGTPPRWMRAPVGLRSPLLEPVLAGAGLRHASWTRRAFDGRCTDPAAVATRLIRRLASGDLLLLHDGSSARMAGGTVAAAALPAVLDAISARGLRAVALPAPLAAPGRPRRRRHASIGIRGRKPSISLTCIQVSTALSRPYLKGDTPPSSRPMYRTGAGRFTAGTPCHRRRTAASGSKSKRRIPDDRARAVSRGRIG